ncbi:hypothetical protein DRN69_01445 [Candidatus Pacearchaeota archaeon]|nr:MAG: hypothetical protein DRN69_01445 [Candidatus Pacearchaeota archaeon]
MFGIIVLNKYIPIFYIELKTVQHRSIAPGLKSEIPKIFFLNIPPIVSETTIATEPPTTTTTTRI